jgi:pimeloyl-ACP methyl ester carboxylesterase
VADRAQELHRAVAGRVFRATGRPAEPVRLTHDAVAGTVYAGVRAGTRAAGAAASRPSRRGRPGRPAGPPSAGAGLVAGALCGVWGDRLEAEGSALAIPMAVRAGGRDVPLTPDALAAAFPARTDRVVVLVHGLCETEDSWRRREDELRGTYATRLARRGRTAVLLRYNSGLPIAENGRRLSALLEGLCLAWPGGVRELAIVGHSMGGLVTRSACHHAQEDGRTWPRALGAVVYLGTPHHGAPLERAVEAGTRLLRRLPEAAPVAATLELRSAGIRDLAHAALTDADPTAAGGPSAPVPLHDGARHHAVAACLGRGPHDPGARLLGDLLVWPDSAHGRHPERPVGIPEADCHRLDGLSHFDLLNHPAVDALLAGWLD